MTKKKELISCRDVLWYLVFFGFAINYMLRLNLNLAIVAMVIPREKPAAAIQCAVEDQHESIWESASTVFHENSKNSSNNNNFVNNSNYGNTTIAPVLSTAVPADTNYQYRFPWTEAEQGLVLGAYYWIHWISQLPGGILARRYGTKLIYGWGNFVPAILGILIPLATHYHINALILLRAIQGFAAGVVWPSMHDMTAKWIPSEERSKFVSSYLGSSVGAAITYPLCAAVINWFGWEAAFYVTSALGIVWYIFWYFLVHDTPKDHPRISDEEKKYILENLSGSISEQKSVPWRELLTSGPVWIAIVAHWGGVWGFLTLLTQSPSYFNFVHGWNINATGLLSGAPHILRMIFSYAFAVMSDWLLRTKRMSLVNVRKLAQFVCTGLQGILTILLSFSGCYPILAVVFMLGGIAVNGAVSTATLAVYVDLSPNYASILLGFAGLVCAGAGVISPIIVGALTNNNQTIEQWRLVFIISAVNLGISCLAYLIWGSADEQPWNNYEKKNEEDGEEMQKLRKTEPDVKEVAEHKVNEKELLQKEPTTS